MTEADQGKIWCVAEYEGGMHDSDKAELTVVGKCGTYYMHSSVAVSFILLYLVDCWLKLQLI